MNETSTSFTNINYNQQQNHHQSEHCVTCLYMTTLVKGGQEILLLNSGHALNAQNDTFNIETCNHTSYNSHFNSIIDYYIAAGTFIHIVNIRNSCKAICCYINIYVNK